MKYFYIICYWLITINIDCQTNLVFNASFESHSLCPDYPGQINYATGWNNVNLVYGNPSVGTPDYFHACGSASLGYNTVPPNIFDGICSPHSGSGMAGTIIYNVPYPDYREYMSTKLSQSMLPGLTYTISFWITNGNPPLSPYVIKNLGVHFSSNPLTQVGWNLINLVPSIEISNYSGSNSWVNHTFTVNPTANWNYLTVGSFRSDINNSPMIAYTGTTGALSSYASYYWDDIEVLAPKGPSGMGESSLINNFEVYPNPSIGNQIFVDANEILDDMKIYDFSGKLIRITHLQSEDKKYKIDVTDLRPGVYFLLFMNNAGTPYKVKILKGEN